MRELGKPYNWTIPLKNNKMLILPGLDLGEALDSAVISRVPLASSGAQNLLRELEL